MDILKHRQHRFDALHDLLVGDIETRPARPSHRPDSGKLAARLWESYVKRAAHRTGLLPGLKSWKLT